MLHAVVVIAVRVHLNAVEIVVVVVLVVVLVMVGAAGATVRLRSIAAGGVRVRSGRRREALARRTCDARITGCVGVIGVLVVVCIVVVIGERGRCDHVDRRSGERSTSLAARGGGER